MPFANMSAVTLFHFLAISCLLQFLDFPYFVQGSHEHAHIYARSKHRIAERSSATSTNLISGWSSLGCYTDDVNSRSLYQDGYTAFDMTEGSCIAYCSVNGFPYAGVEYGDECYCGRVIAASSRQMADSDCNMLCAGDSAKICGAASRLNIFHLDSDIRIAAGPAQNAGPPGWGFLGCFVDSVQSRTLPFGGLSEGGYSALTNALCTQACEKQGYLFAGTEYSGECYCGDNVSDSLLAPDSTSGCDMVCNGNTSEFCGGSNRLNIFGFGQKSVIAPKWTSEGCYTDRVQSRTFRYALDVPGGYTNMTQENCQTSCLSGGYTLAGVEYSQECWCDNSFQGSSAVVDDGQCDMACKGDGTELCGGPNRLNAFKYVGGPTSVSMFTVPGTTMSPSNTVPTTKIVTSATITTTASGQVTGLRSNFTYGGCYVDDAYGRILKQVDESDSLTVESCVASCQGLGYIIAGMEYSTQCFCGNAVVNGGIVAQSDSDCAMPCGGDIAETCGGPNRLSLYTSGDFISYKVPKPYNQTLPGNWSYQGCLSDTPQPRVMPYQVDLNENLTVSNCLDLCQKYGYSAASMEYGQQCFCGDDTDRLNSGAQFLTETQCNTPCPAQPEALCGGANAMSYYTTDSLNVWHQATGTAAGEYQFLLGGVVIPLITQVGINGKVTFIEKHGTGPPNSTGAYVLDLSEVDNFDKAWQTLYGLKTDVFCSAGLMLPDKAGRMINIGGWSAESLFGIRLYTPDGGPGIQGTHDWEENVSDVALQVGRWYPTALQLVNGSILVVGGEDGSNGPPVPNLEVIPRPAGGRLLHMEWLERTDPYNLYPFLTVLPSGNIAVFYYNEALILDEHTFETTRTLPNIPGAVNNNLAGRTYPLEGTFMLLPQHAPYTDPLEVLICGGSTPYTGIALDNCVSMVPEDPDAQWTIERMPDKRVISCMTALPDGTYLILNGAHQGVAGFGLATDPNHMAVLYDPSLPRNQRMTRMANTTIDRLYHSEAVLLMDGRVLVSGSDPEDTGEIKHPQEYRVEVFLPPYLTGGLDQSRPTYSIDGNKTDWTYGESIDITITSGDVSKISLMAAVASTHGNSMGQRTIFPEYSCTGISSNSKVSNTTLNSRYIRRNETGSATDGATHRCTIVAPPNGHITGGPGWHMLFVLNGNGTPSFAQWVRIGGDPAGLGNWPDFPGFTLPGL